MSFVAVCVVFGHNEGAAVYAGDDVFVADVDFGLSADVHLFEGVQKVPSVFYHFHHLAGLHGGVHELRLAEDFGESHEEGAVVFWNGGKGHVGAGARQQLNRFMNPLFGVF